MQAQDVMSTQVTTIAAGASVLLQLFVAMHLFGHGGHGGYRGHGGGRRDGEDRKARRDNNTLARRFGG